MGSGLERRRGRERAVVVNALTKPTNVIVPAGMLVAGFLLGWLVVLVPLAIVLYGLLVGLTLFDEDEARRVLARARTAELPPRRQFSTVGLPSRIADPMEVALFEEIKIEQAIRDAELPYAEVSSEVRVLVEELEKVARKGTLIHDYLADPEVAGARGRLDALRTRASADGPAVEAEQMAIEALEAQVEIQAELEDQFVRCCAELEHLAASLGVVRGEIVRMSVAEDASVQDDLADQVRDLRRRVSSVAEGLSEAAAQLGPAASA
jgi:hypothetical protein